MAHTITLIPGDGIGPEVTAAAVRVVEATGVDVEWEPQEVVGHAAIEQGLEPLPGSVVDSIRKNGIALKGPITTPVGGGFKSVNVQLRQKLDLYANVRPCVSLPGVSPHFTDVNLVIFRETPRDFIRGSRASTSACRLPTPRPASRARDQNASCVSVSTMPKSTASRRLRSSTRPTS